jgi:hypothetical protein
MVAPQPRRRGGPRLLRLLLLLGIGFWIYQSGAGDDIRRAVDDVRTSIQGKEAAGLQAGSLIRRQEFTQAMDALGGHGQRVASMILAPGRINATLVTGEDRNRVVEVTPGPEVDTLTTGAPGSFKGQSLELHRLDPAAPDRLARVAAGRFHVTTDQVDFLAFTFVGAVPRWIVYFKDERTAWGDIAGRLDEPG